MKKKAYWIWYPGDFEIWMGNRFNNRRTERGAMVPPFWKQDSHYATVVFVKKVTLTKKCTAHIAVEGTYNVMVDGKLLFGMPETLSLPPGEHTINIKVHCLESPPALFVDGNGLVTDNTWLVTYEDKIWIDENGTAHGSGIYVEAEKGMFTDPDQGPSKFTLPRRPIISQRVSLLADGILADFGRETMGYLILHGIRGEGMVDIYYGESREEALDCDHCETLDRLCISTNTITDCATRHTVPRTEDYTLEGSKAFRFVFVRPAATIRLKGILMDEEYTPTDPHHSGRFSCSDPLLNDIWTVSACTLELTTREFFTDGIKRDRWTWSGDAIQSYLMNYYLHFDTDCVRRTIWQLRGKDPVTAHVNTIMDYSFYWLISVYDYYLYTGDSTFVRQIYPRMVSLMDYCLGRTNGDGMAEGRPDDWVFVDWTDFPMHKRGVLCFEQLLFCRALEAMAACAALLRDTTHLDLPQGSLTTNDYAAGATHYGHLAEQLREKLMPTFWSEQHHALLHAIEEGKMNEQVTRFPNMFAILYGYADSGQRQDILRHVLLNEKVDAITTPYMRFYELDALCMMGQHEAVIDAIRDYWGGMLRLGATSFWEKYNPAEQGTEHLAMYGRPYGKSLCHAWGASPLYILGKHFLGITPTSAGYATYEVRPHLGGLEWMEGAVPTPFGLITVKMDRQHITVHSTGGNGTLIIGEKRIPIKGILKIDFGCTD